jgi:hypothetical protein
VKLVGLIVASLGTYCLAASLHGHEVVSCPSPDGKFAMRCVYADAQPYAGEAAIVDLSTHKDVVALDPNWTLGHARLLWSADSQRVAYFSQKGNGYSTRIFFRNGDALNEIPLPELPTPKLPQNATGSEADTQTRVEPLAWHSPNELVLEKELVNPNWGRGALKITLGFDQNNSPAIRKSEQEKVSVIDYFLLLPAKNFEAPLSAWLREMRGHDRFFPCDAEPEDNVDEKNGYLYCAGSGAEPEFEVALFRHRDGRPLLALCSGELEGPDSVQLQFYEPGSDGKMHEIKRSIFPIADSMEDRWQFDLPREGKTIVVRARKSKKVLHKFTWTGEKFQEDK